MPLSDPMDKVEAGQVVRSGIFVDEMDRPGGEPKVARVEKAEFMMEEKGESESKIISVEPLLRGCMSVLKVQNSESWGQIKSLEKLVKVGSIYLVLVIVRRQLRETEQGKIHGMKLLKIGRKKVYKCGAVIKKKPRRQRFAEDLFLHVGERSFGCLTESMLKLISKFFNFELCYLFLNCCFWIVVSD